MCLTSCGGKHTVERFASAVNIKKKKKVGMKEALQRLQNLEK